MKISGENKKYLLNISRQTLEYYFFGKEKFEPEIGTISENLLEKTATFVTLTKNGQLRGCVGNIIAKFPLYRDVINNTLNAAFSDPRFPQLEKSELNEIKIEISVLSKPRQINLDELLENKDLDRFGIIFQLGFYQATFLPDVWLELPKADDFFSNLSLKAGLNQDAWKDPKAEFFYYATEKFSEI